MNKIFFILILILGLQNNQISAQVNSQVIDTIVLNAMDKFTVAGVAVAVVKDEKIIHQKGYGLQSIDSKVKVNEHTNFAIASNTISNLI